MDALVVDRGQPVANFAANPNACFLGVWPTWSTSLNRKVVVVVVVGEHEGKGRPRLTGLTTRFKGCSPRASPAGSLPRRPMATKAVAQHPNQRRGTPRTGRSASYQRPTASYSPGPRPNPHRPPSRTPGRTRKEPKW